MSRSAVFITASNDYRSTSVGGRGNSKSGKAWINFDWFKEELQDVVKYKGTKREHTVKEYVQIDSGTNSVTTRVNRGEDGSVRVNINFDLDGMAEGVEFVTINLDGKFMQFDPVKLVKYAEFFNSSLGKEMAGNFAVLGAFAMIPDIDAIFNAKTEEEREQAVEHFKEKRDRITDLIKEMEEM
jgi:hypothetical protein